ncbi:MAG: hypothetical protein M3156_07595, partial [Thermoproteota archaeon]|nr:hypothetical protein [Thermoproteota archaeon]
LSCFADISIDKRTSQWETQNGPIQQYVLADIYSWLEAHFGLSLSSYYYCIRYKSKLRLSPV